MNLASKVILAMGGAAAVAALAALLGAQPVAAQTSYRMVCRTGPAMIGALPANTNGPAIIVLRFRKSRSGYAADPAGLRPGECTWMDRPINGNEPDGLTFELDTRLRVSFTSRNRASLVFDGVGGSDYDTVERIMRTVLNGDWFFVQARNANRTGSSATFLASDLIAGRPRTP